MKSNSIDNHTTTIGTIMQTTVLIYYCKTLNVCVPSISRAKQNREIKGREYQLHAKNRTKLLQYYELYGF